MSLTTTMHYLLEIGTEELPASFLETACTELKDKTHEALLKHRLAHGSIAVYETPRRLTLVIEDLAASQTPVEELVKGPPVSVGLDTQGNPTPAAHGFAKKMGVTFSDLAQHEIDGVAYLVYRKHAAGEPCETVLPDILPEMVLSLSGSHFMAWDASDIKFSRPIRWLVSILDNKPLPIQVGLLQSGVASKGHRFFASAPEIPITTVGNYKQALWQQGSVMVDQAERKQVIWEGLQKLAKELGGQVPPNETLLETVTLLVETPALIAGGFDDKYLSLPKEVITTVMAAHQKYFPVEGADGSLKPYFITIANNPNPDARETIRAGNEKVLRARLEDAAFFFQEDCKQPLTAWVEALKGITFQKGLGTLYDKTQRLKSLALALARQLGSNPQVAEDTARAAELCKADLATHMVRELTELQGIMGRHYAILSGEKPTVAQAIQEHYQPRFLGDAVATSPAGFLLSLAEKLDTLVVVFAQKDARYPTGSKDPMGLRRMASGIIQTLLSHGTRFNLDSALSAAYQNLGSLAQESEADTLHRTRQFLLQRLKGHLLDQRYSYDTIDAVLESETSPFEDLNNTLDRLQALKSLQENAERFKQVYEPANRTARILGKGYLPDTKIQDIDPTRFEHPTEGALYEALVKSDIDTLSSDNALDVFVSWSSAVEAFFNHVLVNVEDTKLKENRYRLLSLLNRGYQRFADFTKLVV